MKNYILALVILISGGITAQQGSKSNVSVLGEGIVKVVPDQVKIQLSVENTGNDVIQLKNQNDKTVDAVLNYVKQFEILDKDIQTQHVRLNKSYDYNKKSYNYSASQTITILLKDLINYEPLISGLVEKGINRIDGIVFSSSKSEALKKEARKKAIENAKLKAEEYASVLGQSIGKAIQISEPSNYSPPNPFYRMEAMAVSDSGNQTLAVGEIIIMQSVQVIFELD
ncbi:SIMPL domain-containing protein [uncultured Planktosalinus sp.]|uniref:SIMPL domain-containing protein n=1 Tax=uncultured Planktosalinus sp. TaxID=1810935 RepID=UPI0030DBDD1B